MKRSEEIQNAIKLKEQAKWMIKTDYHNRLADLDRQIMLLNAEFRAIKSGKMPDEVIAI